MIKKCLLGILLLSLLCVPNQVNSGILKRLCPREKRVERVEYSYGWVPWWRRPPVVYYLSPADNAKEVGPNTKLVVYFNEYVYKGTGNIVIKSGSDTVETIPVNSSAVTVSGSTVTITRNVTLPGSTEYYVTIPAGSFVDSRGNMYAGTNQWNFTTVNIDADPPVISGLSPADDTKGVSPTTNLVMTFNENVQKGVGDIIIKKVSDGSVVETISQTAVVVSGKVATINRTVKLEGNTEYYVTVPAGSFKDLAGNPFAGIVDDPPFVTGWNFAVIAVPPPPVKGLNVAIVGPSPRVVRDLTPDQAAILTSRTVRDWMDESCEIADDGLPAFRIISRASGDLTPKWQAIADLSPVEGCSVVAVKGDKNLVVPLPANYAALLDTLSKFSGAAVKPKVGKIPNPPEFTTEQWNQFNPPNKVAVFNGVQRFLSSKPRDFNRHPRGMSLAATGVRVIPRSEWPARIEALKKANAGIVSLIYGKVECHDQGSTNYCWANCVVGAGGNLKYTQGQAPYILSAASVGGPITGYSNVGGWPSDAIAFMQETGAVRINFWPNTAINSSYARKPECTADYPKHKITQAIADLGISGNIFDETVTCVLLGAPVAVSYNWWSHAICAVGVEQQNGKWYLVLRNSWGSDYGDNGFFKLVEGTGSNQGTPNDAQAVLYMTFQ